MKKLLMLFVILSVSATVCMSQTSPAGKSHDKSFAKKAVADPAAGLAHKNALIAAAKKNAELTAGRKPQATASSAQKSTPAKTN